MPPEDFYVEGITKIEKIDFKYAMEMGYTIKHLAVAKFSNGINELRAHPVLISNKSYLANLKSVRNGIEIETDLLGTLHIAGSGAGQESTASGVISDLVHLANSDKNISKNEVPRKKIESIDFLSLSFKYYFYIEAEDLPGVMASISSIFAEKKVGIDSVVQKEELSENIVPIVIITDPFVERSHKELLMSISNLDSVNNVRSIRVEED